MSSSEIPVAPGALPPIAPHTPVQTAIARAAAATGVDFNFLLGQARLESGLDPAARARTSSARGLYQFTGSTWLKTLDRHGADYGLDASNADHDPVVRAHWLAMREDPQVSALMAGELANDNRNYLTGVLGRDPDNTELYLAHFLGPDAAARFVSALASDPGQSAAALLPKAAAANRAIFFSGTAQRSVGQVMDLLRSRLDIAMAGPGQAASAGSGGIIVPAIAVASAPPGGPLAQEFAANAAPPLAASSMADTLQSAFGTGETGESAMPANVREAYGRIRALGL